jgi:tRNA dimethylallyltransferase
MSSPHALPIQPATALPPYLALIGPTASGKTAAALALAQHRPIEIISMDSALVYRGMDIGSAKPSLAEQAAVVHHLIDIRDPLQAYSAAEFARDTRALMQAIHDRGRWPVLVGGTMLYLKALQQGLDDMPQAQPEVRQRIATEAAERGWPAMHQKLARVDPATAARLASHDAQRISRALEVYAVSGQPLSAFHQHRPKPPNDNCLLLSLEPQDRAWLHARIAQRFETMLAQGFLDEVQALRARGDLHLDLPSMRCVGYRQAWEALDGLWPMRELPERGIAATRQLAKRQITWLRSTPERHVVACDGPDPIGEVLALALRFMHATQQSAS